MYALKSMDGVVPKLGVGAIRLNSDILTFPTISDVKRRVKVPAAPNERYTGLVPLFSTATGEPLAIFPDGMIQPMRVAATTALGAKALSREDASVVTILVPAGRRAAERAPSCACARSRKCASIRRGPRCARVRRRDVADRWPLD